MPSSAISSFADDAERRRLTVRFISGRVYVYRDVPQTLGGLADALYGRFPLRIGVEMGSPPKFG